MKKSFITVALALFVSFFITFTFACSTTVEEPAPEEAKTEQQEEKKTEPPASNGGSSGGTSQGGGSNPAGGQNGGGQTPLTPESGTPPQTPPQTPETPQPPAPVVYYTITFMSNWETTVPELNSARLAENTVITIPGYGSYRAGFVFTGWNTSADGTGTGYAVGSTIRLTGNLTLYAQWLSTIVPTYSVEINEVEHGTVAVSQSVAEAGTQISITVTPNELYAFNTINITAANETVITPVVDPENANQYTFTMPEQNVTLSVTFVYIAHSITVAAVENGTVTVNKTVAVAGSEISVTVTPNEFYALSAINITAANGTVITSVVDSENANQYTFTMPEQNVTLSVTFVYIAHSITVSSVENGTVTVNKTAAVAGSEISVTLAPNSEYMLNSISVTSGNGNAITTTVNTSNSNLYTFTMPDENVTVMVSYKLTPYTVTFVTDCSVQVPPQTVERNAKATAVTMSNNSECEGFLGWYTDQTCTNQFDLSETDITDNIFLYAKWEKFKVTNENIANRIASLRYSCWIVASGFFDNLGIREINAALKQLYTNNENIKVSLDCLEANIGELEDASVASNCFYGCNNLKEIKLPPTLLTIGKKSFYECTSLERVVISEGTLEIKDYVFSKCSVLTEVVIPSGITEIAGGAFMNCGSLTNLVIPSVVTKIGENAFYGCKSFTSITIPSGVTEIAGGAFMNCESLTNLEIPSGVTKIGENAFFGCKALTSITIPSGVTKIGKYAFFGCEALTSIMIPNGITEIADWTFAFCESLADITIPSGVTKIGSNAFESCAFTSFTIPSGVTEFGYGVFTGCNFTSFTIPDFMTEIPEGMFILCGKLQSITIHDRVTKIGANAFNKCSALKSVTIPSSILEIGKMAFYSADVLNFYLEQGSVWQLKNDNGVVVETVTVTENNVSEVRRKLNNFSTDGHYGDYKYTWCKVE